MLHDPVLLASEALVRAAWALTGAALLQALASGMVIWGALRFLRKNPDPRTTAGATAKQPAPRDVAHEMLNAFNEWAERAATFKQGLKEADFHAADYALTALLSQHSILTPPEPIGDWAGSIEKFGKAANAVDMAIRHARRLNRDKIKYRYELDTFDDMARGKLARVVCLQCRVCADAIIMAKQAIVSAFNEQALSHTLK